VTRGEARPGEFPEPPPALAVPTVDAHCHLDLMPGDPADSVAAAVAVGVTRIVQVGVDVESSRWGVEFVRGRAGLSAAVAIHPNEAATATDDDIDTIAKLAGDDVVVAIGETGLDHFRTDAGEWTRQEDGFRRHIEIAKQTGKTLMIHDRDAHGDVLRVLDEMGAPDRVMLHCFSGDATFAAACVERGFVLSFAGNVTFKNAQNLRDAAAVTPLEQLLVETDAPFLTPMPYRGRPNGPFLIPLTVRALADVKGVDETELATATAATFGRLFGPAEP
jgi:TatD DNase family protein